MWFGRAATEDHKTFMLSAGGIDPLIKLTPMAQKFVSKLDFDRPDSSSSFQEQGLG